MESAPRKGPTIINNQFTQLLAQALFFTEQARLDPPDSGVRAAYAQSAILLAVYALESCGNLLLATTTQGRFLDDVDQLPTLSKFQFFLSVKNGSAAQFDRGAAPIQMVQELITFRNKLVHPRTQTTQILLDENDHISADSIGYSNFLKLPETTNNLNSEHSDAALRAVDRFLEFFFLDLCKMTETETWALLCHYIVVGDERTAALSKMLYDQAPVIDRLGLSLRIISTKHGVLLS